MGLTGLFTHKPDVLSYILDLQVNSGIGVLENWKSVLGLGNQTEFGFSIDNKLFTSESITFLITISILHLYIINYHKHIVLTLYYPNLGT